MKTTNFYYILIGILVLLFIPFLFLILDIILTPGIPSGLIIFLGFSMIILPFVIYLWFFKKLLKEGKEIDKKIGKEKKNKESK